MNIVIAITNLISQVLHAVPLYVHIVRENLSRPNCPNVVTSVRHWWAKGVVTVDDYQRYMLCEDIKEASGMLGRKSRYDWRKHTLDYLQDILDSKEQEYARFRFQYNNGKVDEFNNPIECSWRLHSEEEIDELFSLMWRT